MAVQIPAQAIADARAGAGELWQVVLAIAGPESDWHSQAIGDGGCSIGYLQMNMCGGLGSGISKDVLLDGPTNFRLGANYIRGRLNQGATLYDALQPWSARPAAWALYQRIQAEGIQGISSTGVDGAVSLGDPKILLALVVLAVIVLGRG